MIKKDLINKNMKQMIETTYWNVEYGGAVLAIALKMSNQSQVDQLKGFQS